MIESAWDAPYKGPNKDRSGSGPSIVDFWPYGLGVALARSITLTGGKAVSYVTTYVGPTASTNTLIRYLAAA